MRRLRPSSGACRGCRPLPGWGCFDSDPADLREGDPEVGGTAGASVDGNQRPGLHRRDGRVRQSWMGHSTIQLTERTYNHVRPAAHEAAAKLAADYWLSNTRPASM
jgi:hypothetical protein